MKKILPFILAFFLIAVAVAYFIPVRPVVIVQNATKDPVYLHSAESVYGIEPTPHEVDKIMRAHPDMIGPGKELKIKGSFSSIIIGGYELSIGWSIGGQFEYNSNGGGGQNILFSSRSDICSVKIIIQPGYNHFELGDQTQGICLKKISFIKHNY